MWLAYSISYCSLCFKLGFDYPDAVFQSNFKLSELANIVDLDAGGQERRGLLPSGLAGLAPGCIF